MDRMEFTRSLRLHPTIHYNCCQSVLIPFAQEMGISQDQAFALGAHFGSGMRHGATCGVLSGGLMVLGALGRGDQDAMAAIRLFRQNHCATDCATLLKTSHDRGEAKKDHCDGLVYEMVQLLDQLLAP